MKTPLLLSLFSLLLNLTAFGQQTPYEEQYVVLADGREALIWISLDEQSELLHYKVSESDTPEVYSPDAIISFQYGKHYYYSLPLREGYHTFFRVYHEGSKYAVLEKVPSYKALRMIADESEGNISLCQNKRSNEFTLCFRETRHNNQPFMASTVTTHTRKFEVRKLIYLAIEDKLRLFYMDSDEGFNLWNDLVVLDANKRKTLNTLDASKRSTQKTLSDMINDPQKMSVVDKKIKQDKLDLRNPEHLIQALETVYP
jgi:hypothetical protein